MLVCQAYAKPHFAVEQITQAIHARVQVEVYQLSEDEPFIEVEAWLGDLC